MPARVVALANQKGGVGKTTTSINLSACVAEKGRRTLLIDFDPQANATSGLGVEKQDGRSLYPVLIDGADPSTFIVPTAVTGLELIPAEVNLAGAEIEVARSERYLHRLRDALAPLVASDRYEFIFIDCPPSLGVLTMNALCTAHRLLMPIQSEYYALEGLSVMVRLIEQLRAGANPDLSVAGLVMTMYDNRTSLSRQVWQQVREHFGEQVYETLIPRSIRLGEAPSHGQPIILYDPHALPAAAYRNLAREFLKRESA